jgi:hypothetical protein
MELMFLPMSPAIGLDTDAGQDEKAGRAISMAVIPALV